VSGRRGATAPVDPNDQKVKSETSFLLLLNINYAALPTGPTLRVRGKRKSHGVCLFINQNSDDEWSALAQK
jgi:hypothetical protein